MEELKKIYTTLLLVFKDNKVLLGEKKRGFAKGTLIGIGGKQERGETNEQAMIRETQEEIGITPTKYQLIGDIHFDSWYKGEHVDMYMSIYSCTEFKGSIAETEEMKPNWYDKNNLPYEKMLEDDLLWLPMAIEGKHFKGEVKFSEKMEMINHYFEEINENNKDKC